MGKITQSSVGLGDKTLCDSVHFVLYFASVFPWTPAPFSLVHPAFKSMPEFRCPLAPPLLVVQLDSLCFGSELVETSDPCQGIQPTGGDCCWPFTQVSPGSSFPRGIPVPQPWAAWGTHPSTPLPAHPAGAWECACVTAFLTALTLHWRRFTSGLIL